MGMKVEIDPFVEFTFNGERSLKVDVLDLEDFVTGFFDANGVEEIGEDGKKTKVIYDWKIIEDGVREWIKAQKNTENLTLSRTELRLFWMKSRDIWQKKSQSLREPEPGSPTSLPSTDLESLD
jgi:hypothetical protein